MVIESKPGLLIFHNQPFTRGGRIWSAVGTGMAAFMLVFFPIQLFAGGVEKCHCDRLADVCVEQPSGRVIAKISAIKRVALGFSDLRDTSQNGGVVISLADGRDTEICASGVTSGGETRGEIVDDLRDFLKSTSQPSIDFKCMRGRGSPIGTLATMAGTVIPFSILVYLLAFRRHLYQVRFDKARGIVQFRFASSLVLLGYREENHPLSAIKKVHTQSIDPAPGTSTQRLELALWFSDGTTGMAVAKIPISPKAQALLDEGLSAIEDFAGLPTSSN